MTDFSRAWTAAYLGLPPNSEDARKGASRIRDLKVDLTERMQVDHAWFGDDKDGTHTKVTLYPADTDPATIPAGIVYAKMVGTGAGADVELFYKSKNGVITQLTSTGSPFGSYVFPGTIIMVGNTYTAGNMAPAYLDCDGSAYSRTTYAQLFNAISILWGAGDGVTTFNMPDFRGRAPIGAGPGVGLTNRLVAGKVGEENHVLTVAELPDHPHPIPGSDAALVPGTTAYQGTNVQTVQGATGPTASLGNLLKGDPHNTMQPSLGVRFVIKT